MSSIVEYTNGKPAENLYPVRIISPRKSGACCFSDMEMVGETHAEGRWVFQYRRCRKCGFAVRVILRQLPDEELMAAVRMDFATLFVRKLPDFWRSTGRYAAMWLRRGDPMGESLDWVSADPVANGFVFSGRPQGSPCFLWAGSDTPVRVRENLLKGADWLGRDPRRV